MSKTKNGGAAFPRPAVIHPDSARIIVPAVDGMSLRNYFAAKALQGMLANEQYDEFLGSGDFTVVVDRYAQMAYRYADAMIKAGSE